MMLLNIDDIRYDWQMEKAQAGLSEEDRIQLMMEASTEDYSYDK